MKRRGKVNKKAKRSVGETGKGQVTSSKLQVTSQRKK